MDESLEQRLIIYAPLALLCAVAGFWLGSAAAIWSFVQILAVIELTYWLGMPVSTRDAGVQSN